jgi:hypothetical protein
VSANNGTTDYFSPRPTCDGCEQPILGGIYRRGPERLCRPCYAPAPSTTRILGCQVVRFEKAPCEPVTTPPPPPRPPVAETTTVVTDTSPPDAAYSRSARSGDRSPKAPSVRGRGQIPKGEMSPKNAAFAQTVLQAVAKGWILRAPLIEAQPKARRKAATQVICRLVKAGTIEASTTWIGPAGSTPPPHTRSLQSQVLELIAERPRSRRELSARFRRVDATLGHLATRGHIESVGGLWRLKARH